MLARTCHIRTRIVGAMGVCLLLLGACQATGEAVQAARNMSVDGVSLVSNPQHHGCWGHTDVPGEALVQIPCPEDMTDAFIKSLQRALAVRGYMAHEITGDADTRTRAAVRAYQAARGFDSPVLTLRTARELGLIAYDPSEF